MSRVCEMVQEEVWMIQMENTFRFQTFSTKDLNPISCLIQTEFIINMVEYYESTKFLL